MSLPKAKEKKSLKCYLLRAKFSMQIIRCHRMRCCEDNFFYHFQQNENKQNNKPPTIYHAIGHFAPANPLNNDLKNRAKNSSNILASLAQDAQHACFRFVYSILWFYHRGGTPSSPTVTIKHLLNCFILFRSVDKALFIIITARCERVSERASWSDSVRGRKHDKHAALSLSQKPRTEKNILCKLSIWLCVCTETYAKCATC